MKKSKSKMSRGAQATAAHNEINRAGQGKYLVSTFIPSLDTLFGLFSGTPDERRTHDAGLKFLASVIKSPRGTHGCHFCDAELNLYNMPFVLIVQQSGSPNCETVIASGLCETCASSPDAYERIKKPIIAVWPKGEFRPISDEPGAA